MNDDLAVLGAEHAMCETPKSPPGDYNSTPSNPAPAARSRLGVKHLNPRQGITTMTIRARKYATIMLDV